jgi:hypothetical protein
LISSSAAAAAASSSSSSIAQPQYPTAPFHHHRSTHEACLRRLTSNPLPAGRTEQGDTEGGYGVKLFDDGACAACCCDATQSTVILDHFM